METKSHWWLLKYKSLKKKKKKNGKKIPMGDSRKNWVVLVEEDWDIGHKSHKHWKEVADSKFLLEVEGHMHCTCLDYLLELTES